MEEIKSVLRHSTFGEIKQWFADVEHDPLQSNSSLKWFYQLSRVQVTQLSDQRNHSDHFQTLLCRSSLILVIPKRYYMNS